MAGDPTKTTPGQLPVGAKTLSQRYATFVGNAWEKQKAIRNWTTPKPQKLSNGTYAYLTAPNPLKRLFGSPLLMEGIYATGPNKERALQRGWTDFLTVVNGGLEYKATPGENVLACGDGRVTFVGYVHASRGLQSVPGIYAKDDNSALLGADGMAVVVPPAIGEGGICVKVQYAPGDFNGYQMEYYHLSKVLVAVGAVAEGQPIGLAGQTGTVDTPMLRVVLAYSAGGKPVIVDPTALVPNSYPGHPDSTELSANVLLADYIDPGPGGQALMQGVTATALRTHDRATGTQNVDRKKIADAQANHMAYVAQTAGQQQQVLEAVAKYQQAGLIVMSPMTFDFDNGYWVDGTGKNRPV